MSYIVSALDNRDGWSIKITGGIFYNHSGSASLYNFDGTYGSLDVINCTFYNSICGNTPILITCTTTNFYNNIIYNTDNNCQLYVRDNTGMGFPAIDINMSHNLVYGGESGIWTSPNNNLNWLEGNIDYDPLLFEQEIGIGFLDEDSPCRDAGTLDLPVGITLSEYDVYGYSRVYGDNIDIGAVEWTPGQVASDVNEIGNEGNELLVYPNPAFISEMRKPGLNIVWLAKERSSGNMELEVFNIFGQKVYSSGVIENGFTLEKPGVWDFRNQDGKLVSSGFYIVRLKAGNEYQVQQKLTVIK
ncbi:MAG: T9SS type A sorting domain-containing protein [Candidatus Cloacimonetes bacterium]|nr:T9SS type A sorting domain-containing protein [Candidatus Cloacimonadota bacterium]